MTGEAMSHAAFAAARANFHNQSIVDHLPADASAASGRPQQIAAAGERMAGTAVIFSEFYFTEMLSKPKRDGRVGISLAKTNLNYLNED